MNNYYSSSSIYLNTPEIPAYFEDSEHQSQQLEESPMTEEDLDSFSVTGSEFGSDSILDTAFYKDDDSVSTTVSRRFHGKKQTTIINKLKMELAQTRNMLAVTKANDIMILRSKLRTAESDLSRVQFQNRELKEDMEKLETKLFEALSASQKATDKQKGRYANGKETEETTKVPAADIIETQLPNNVIRNPVNSKVDAAHEMQRQEHQLPSVSRAKYTRLDQILSDIPKDISQQVHVLMRQTIENTAEADRKTISELVKELHRLEDTIKNINVKERRNQSTSTDNLDPQINNEFKKEEPFNLYTNRDLLYCFFLGVIFMLISSLFFD